MSLYFFRFLDGCMIFLEGTVIAYPIEFLVLIVIGRFVDLSHDVALVATCLCIKDFEAADHYP